MDEAAKKHALRMVPYGLYLMGTKAGDAQHVSLVSWFTQTSFAPPLVALGCHREGAAFAALKESGVFSLNILADGQQDILKSFFKHVDVEGDRAGDQPVVDGSTGCPILTNLPAAIECKVHDVVEIGDHATVVAEVVDAHVHDKEAVALTHGAAKLHYAG